MAVSFKTMSKGKKHKQSCESDWECGKRSPRRQQRIVDVVIMLKVKD